MASVKPFVGLRQQERRHCFFYAPETKLIEMSKNNESLAKAWAMLTSKLGRNTPKQIKNSIFIIQNRLLLYPNPEVEQDRKLNDAITDLSFLYDFMDEIELQTN